MKSDDKHTGIALIADDDELMQLMLTEAAISAGFETLVVNNGKEAIAAAAESVPDIILLDVNMPEMDGFAACEILRASEENALTPIVMVTGNDDSDSINRAYQCGATDFISKPINWSLLAHRLRYILRGADNLKALQIREQKIHHLAYYDELTGLPNRELLRDTTNNMLSKSIRAGEEVALLYLNMDGFKRINDSFGHKIGDKMLRAIGKRLKLGLKQITESNGCCSILARAGGDEFIAAISSSSVAALADTAAEKWLECLQRPFAREGNELHMTPSIGIAASPGHGTDFESLMKNAGTAMDASKKRAPGQFTEYCDSMHTASLQRVQTESALREALRHDRLEVHYQPKYAVESGAIAGAEALLRWNDADRGWVSPAEFIPIAEESGLILDINHWVVNVVCQQLNQWSQEGLDVPVAVNISAAEFLHGDLVSLIASACEHHDVCPGLLEVEITESTLMRDIDRARDVLAQLKAMNVRISVDDFGTGYSSLAYLKRFDIDTLKIDRSFVDELGTNSDDRAICRAVLGLAKNLSLDVVAEGVETFEQHAWLAAEQCDFVQGYLWSRPLPKNEFRGLLLESTVSADNRLSVTE